VKEEIELYIRRAEKFERDARFDFEHGDNDLAMFHIEQAFQLMIKAKLLDLKGYFERTHSLRKLLRDLAEVYKKKEIMSYIDRYKVVLRNLERAYITSRYYFEEFFNEEVEEAFKALKELKRLLWSE